MEVWKLAFKDETTITTCGELGKINSYDVEERESVGELKSLDIFASALAYVLLAPLLCRLILTLLA